MPKRVKGGATTKYGKKVIGLYIPPELKNRIENAAKKIGITRTAYIIVAINEALERDEKGGTGKEDCSHGI